MRRILCFILCFAAAFGVNAQESINEVVSTTTLDKQLPVMIKEQRLYTYKSQFSVEQTMTRLEKQIKNRQIPIFAILDHANNAKEVGMQMNSSKVIIFGSPKVGTVLMQENPSIALALPLKIAVYEDAKGNVWTSFLKMKFADQIYPLNDKSILLKMDELLEDLTIKSSKEVDTTIYF